MAANEIKKKHPTPWVIYDPNGAFNKRHGVSGFRPVWLRDAKDKDVLYIGNAGQTPSTLQLAKMLVDLVNGEKRNG